LNSQLIKAQVVVGAREFAMGFSWFCSIINIFHSFMHQSQATPWYLWAVIIFLAVAACWYFGRKERLTFFVRIVKGVLGEMPGPPDLQIATCTR